MNRIIGIILTSLLIFSAFSCGPKEGNQEVFDLFIYGGTSAAVTAAVQAKKMGKSVVVVSPDIHLGGLTSGGLGWTDTGKKEVIGGLSREFYQRLYNHYQTGEAWKWEEKSEYGNVGQGTPAIDGDARTMWIFESHAAQQVYEDFIQEYGIEVLRDEWLDRKSGVTKEGNRIVAIRTLSGKEFKGKMFIDATYEGDLMAAAGISYHVGREANSVYGETWNGVQTDVFHHHHHFNVLDKPIDPYVIEGIRPAACCPGSAENIQGKKGPEMIRCRPIASACACPTIPTTRFLFQDPIIMISPNMSFWRGFLMRVGTNGSANSTRFPTANRHEQSRSL